MFYYLHLLASDVSFFRVFQYITFRTIYATVTALLISFLLGPYTIRLLRRLKAGQPIRLDGPESHYDKKNTPTMGGILILLALVPSTLLWADLGSIHVWVVLAVTMGSGLVGFVDDYKKVSKKDPRGLPGKQKLLFQSIVAAAACGTLVAHPGFDTHLTIPFFKTLHPDLGWFYVVFGMLVIVGASNAVNLTDGLDGLAIVPVAVTAATYLVFAYVAGNIKFATYLQIPHVVGAGEVAVFCGALVGASMGFLWYNCHPAQLFMGDVGSLALGGALGSVAVTTKQELTLVIVGGLFVVEAVSVMVQTGWFKYTRIRYGTGKRIFRMAPIHHHFEKLGWPETKVTVRFWIIAILLALLSMSTLKLR